MIHFARRVIVCALALLICSAAASASSRMAVIHRDVDGDGAKERQVIVNHLRDDGSVLVFIKTYAPDGRLLSEERDLIPPSADLTGDGVVDATDLAMVTGAWGQTSSPADLNHDGVVNGADLRIVLEQFGKAATADDRLRVDCPPGCWDTGAGCDCDGEPPDDGSGGTGGDGSLGDGGGPTFEDPNGGGTQPPDDPLSCTAAIDGPDYVLIGDEEEFTVTADGAIASAMWADPSPSGLVEVDGSTQSSPTLRVTGLSPGAVTLAVTVTTTDGATCMADFEFDVIGFDLDIDSDNNGTIEEEEDEIEDDPSLPGHVILANTFWGDTDALEGLADGFDLAS